MYNIIKVKEDENQITVSVSYKIKTAAKIFSLFSFAALFTFSIFGFYTLIKNPPPVFLFIVLSLALLIFLLASLNYIKFFNYRETYLISRTHLSVLEKFFFYETKNKFYLKKIKQLQIIDSNKKIPHPISTEQFDAIGFDTKQEEINSVIKQEKISFLYDNEVIKIGRTLYHTEAQDIINLILKQINKA